MGDSNQPMVISGGERLTGRAVWVLWIKSMSFFNILFLCVTTLAWTLIVDLLQMRWRRIWAEVCRVPLSLGQYRPCAAHWGTGYWRLASGHIRCGISAFVERVSMLKELKWVESLEFCQVGNQNSTKYLRDLAWCFFVH